MYMTSKELLEWIEINKNKKNIGLLHYISNMQHC
jgi:hypothetical protein